MKIKMKFSVMYVFGFGSVEPRYHNSEGGWGGWQYSDRTHWSRTIIQKIFVVCLWYFNSICARLTFFTIIPGPAQSVDSSQARSIKSLSQMVQQHHIYVEIKMRTAHLSHKHRYSHLYQMYDVYGKCINSEVEFVVISYLYFAGS